MLLSPAIFAYIAHSYHRKGYITCTPEVTPTQPLLSMGKTVSLVPGMCTPEQLQGKEEDLYLNPYEET
jgi:hypothetical protein